MISIKYLILSLWTRESSIPWTGNSMKRNLLDFVKGSEQQLIPDKRRKSDNFLHRPWHRQIKEVFTWQNCLWKEKLNYKENKQYRQIKQDTTQGITAKNHCSTDIPLGTSHQTSLLNILNRSSIFMTLSSTHRAKWQFGRREKRIEINTVSQILRSWTCWCQLAPDHQYKLEHPPPSWATGNQEAFTKSKGIFFTRSSEFCLMKMPVPPWLMCPGQKSKDSICTVDASLTASSQIVPTHAWV